MAHRTAGIRAPAVAGTFYPGPPSELEAQIAAYLSRAGAAGPERPKALIAPHAGYVYSGPVAASAYATLGSRRAEVSRVVLLGPSHRFGFEGLALPDAVAFSTPLGEVPIDRPACRQLLALPQVHTSDRAHAQEHSLEVHLPFLQHTLEAFSLVPLSVGDATTDEVADVLETVWGGPETLIVISTDLSHYYGYEEARRRDAATAEAIEGLRGDDLGDESACGRIPTRGLLAVARRRKLSVRRLDVRNSGDTAGPRDRVVGYGAWAIG